MGLYRNFEYNGHIFQTAKSYLKCGNTVFYSRPFWTGRDLKDQVYFKSEVSLADLRKQIREHVDNKNSAAGKV